MQSKKMTFLITLTFIFLPAGLLFGEGVTVERVKPNKVLYLYNEQATAMVSLKSTSGATQKGTLKVTEEWDVTESRSIWSGVIEMPPGAAKEVPVSWNVRTIMYGRGLRAEYLQNNKVISSKTEFYQVADPKDWFRTFLLNGAWPPGSADKDPFITYGNFDNHFAYSPSGFACLAPEVDEWVNQQCNFNIKKSDMVKTITLHHANGIRAGGYTISNTAGSAGYELARQHPEWFLRDAKGAFNPVNTPVNPLELAQPITKPCSSWYCLYPDFGNPEVVQFAGEEVVRAMRMFGFDAMFFDTVYNIIGAYFNTPSAGAPPAIFLWDGAPLGRGESLDTLSARCAAEVDRIVHASFPQAVLWYNGASPRAGWIKTHEAALRHPLTGSLSECQGGQILTPSFCMHTLRSYYEGMANERDSYLKHQDFNDPMIATGYMYNLDPLGYMTKEEYAATRDLWTTSNHLGAVYIATRLHPCVVGVSAFRPMAQFMTRYSAFLWGRDVKLLTRPWKIVNVESNRDVWWRECVYTRETSRFRDLIINIVNSPENESFDLKVASDPQPAKYVEVEVKLAEKVKKVRVWALQMHGYDAKERVPTQVELTPLIQDGKILVELPQFTYHTLVVVRQWK